LGLAPLELLPPLPLFPLLFSVGTGFASRAAAAVTHTATRISSGMQRM
jgi:hypothetical protein